MCKGRSISSFPRLFDLRPCTHQALTDDVRFYVFNRLKTAPRTP